MTTTAQPPFVGNIVDNLTRAIARRVSELPEAQQDAVIEVLEDSTRRRGWIDRDLHDYVVAVDDVEFVRVPMQELLA